MTTPVHGVTRRRAVTVWSSRRPAEPFFQSREVVVCLLRTARSPRDSLALEKGAGEDRRLRVSEREAILKGVYQSAGDIWRAIGRTTYLMKNIGQPFLVVIVARRRVGGLDPLARRRFEVLIYGFVVRVESGDSCESVGARFKSADSRIRRHYRLDLCF